MTNELIEVYEELEKAWADFEIALKDCQESSIQARNTLAKIINGIHQ